MSELVRIFFITVFVVSCTVNAIRFVHILQLSSYKNLGLLKWYYKNIKSQYIYIIFALISLVLALAVFQSNWPGDLLFSAVFIISSYFNYPKKAKQKKPLVYTNRVKRLIASVSCLFLLASAGCYLICGLLSEMVYIAMTCAFIITPFIVCGANIINLPLQKFINRHYINEAKSKIRSMQNLKVIGITGSFGKTSVKYFLYKLLSTEYNVLMTPESYNTTLGVVITVRRDLKPSHDIFIAEMGARHLGDIKEIADIVKPEFGIITSIGPQHLETFKSIENIIKTKFELIDSLSDSGTAVLNFDNEYIRKKAAETDNRKIIGYSAEFDINEIGTEVDNFYSVHDISCGSKGSSFEIRLKNGEKEVFKTKLLGIHNVLNIAAAIAMSNVMGISLKNLVFPVKTLESVPHRLQLIPGKGITIIDDAFNSNPSGAKAALDTLKNFDGMKVLITPGMVELGEKQDELNFEFGVQAASVCDFIVLVGKNQTESILKGIQKQGFPKDKIYISESFINGMEKIRNFHSNCKRECFVLIENDLPDNY